MPAKVFNITDEKSQIQISYKDLTRMAAIAKTQKTLAYMLGVHENTLVNYKNKDKDFCDAIDDAKNIVNEEVISILFNDKILTEKDLGAIKYWLNNRDTAEWADKTKVEQTVELKGNVLDKLDESYESND